MRKSLLLITALLLSTQFVHAVVTATTVWEFRQDAGNANNGPCFDPSVAVPGTDYSQQASSQYNNTDLVIDGANNTKITSAGHNFVAADEGNCIRVSAGTGFTVGWYVITDTASNAATLSSAVGTVGSTGGTYRVGGAALLNSTNASDYFAAMVAGNTVWFLYNASVYTTGETVTVTVDATSILNVNVIGYNATRGDNPTGTSRPTIDFGTAAFNVNGDYFNFHHLIITGTAAYVFLPGIGAVIENVKVSNTSGTASRIAMDPSSPSKVFGSEFVSTNGTALANFAISVFVGNYIHDSVTCVSPKTDSNIFAFNIFDNCSTAAMSLGSGIDQHYFLFNTFYGAETPAGTGILAASTQGINTVLYGNIFYGFTTALDFNANVQSTFADYNDFYNNTNDPYTGTPPNVTSGAHDENVNPTFTSAAAGNFSIGTNLKALGFPGLFPGGFSTGYLDIGAVQRQEAAAGGQKAYSFVQ